MEDSRPIFSCKRFSYNENALYLLELFALEGFICLAELGRLLWPPALGLERGLLTAGTAVPVGV